MTLTVTETRTLNKDERDLLRKALDDDLTLGEILEQAEGNQGTLYTLHTDKLVGVAYFQVFGDILNLRKMSGIEIHTWKKEFQDFVIHLMRKHNIPKFVIFSRKGWHRIFPSLTYEGSIYTLSL